MGVRKHGRDRPGPLQIRDLVVIKRPRRFGAMPEFKRQIKFIEQETCIHRVREGARSKSAGNCQAAEQKMAHQVNDSDSWRYLVCEFLMQENLMERLLFFQPRRIHYGVEQRTFALVSPKIGFGNVNGSPENALKSE